jgi:hypothetical protein
VELSRIANAAGAARGRRGWAELFAVDMTWDERVCPPACRYRGRQPTSIDDKPLWDGQCRGRVSQSLSHTLGAKSCEA